MYALYQMHKGFTGAGGNQSSNSEGSNPHPEQEFSLLMAAGVKAGESSNGTSLASRL